VSEPLKNELVWSHSRARAFEGCARAYWYQYYGSFGGWEAEATAEQQQAWVEKKLTSIPMWLGSTVHRAAEIGLQLARDGEVPDVEQARAWARRTATRDLEDSASGRWRERPARRVGLKEHYYGESVPAAALDAALTEIDRQIQVLFAQRVFRRLLAVPQRIQEVEELQRFRDGDVEIYVSLDVLVANEHGGLVIVDWKTGAAHDDADIAAQLGVYGLYTTLVLGAAPGSLRAMHVNLREDRVVQHAVGPAEIAAARSEIGASISGMRARLRDVDANLADREAFPTEEEGSPHCRWCSFRGVCGRA
jgi:hypothetical protein